MAAREMKCNAQDSSIPIMGNFSNPDAYLPVVFTYFLC
jgi:hypothetical protein